MLLAAAAFFAVPASASAAQADADLGIFVVTANNERFLRRARQAVRTWAADYKEVLFVAASAAGLPAGRRVEAVPCEDGPGASEAVCCKVVEGFQLALQRFPAAHWLVMASDDTYVFVEQLRKELEIFSPTKQIYVGAPGLLLACWFSEQPDACGEAHAGGGAYVLSRPLAVELVKLKGLYMAGCMKDDARMGHLLRHALDVHVQPLPGIKNEPRISHISWGRCGGGGSGGIEDTDCYTIRSCPRLLPPPVYAGLDQAGSIFPFAPLDATRLALVQSDPAVWPALSLLPGAAAELAEQGRVVLVYLDFGGHRMVGRHYEGLETLSVCAHFASERLSGFRAAASPDAVDVMRQPKVAQLAALRWLDSNNLGYAYREACADRCHVTENHQVKLRPEDNKTDWVEVTVRVSRAA